jgi:hypothetical protein
MISSLYTPSRHFSEPGFWKLIKGGLRQPVLVLPYPNSVQVLGMEQPKEDPPVECFKKINEKSVSETFYSTLINPF